MSDEPEVFVITDEWLAAMRASEDTRWRAEVIDDIEAAIADPSRWVRRGRPQRRA